MERNDLKINSDFSKMIIIIIVIIIFLSLSLTTSIGRIEIQDMTGETKKFEFNHIETKKYKLETKKYKLETKKYKLETKKYKYDLTNNIS